MAGGTILLVDDDETITSLLQRALVREGYTVDCVSSGEVAIAAVSTHAVDLVLLDLGLPDVDGIEVCRRLRAGGSDVPVMMLTARGDELDRVVGLDVGADDYLPKPFSLAELLARVRALLRRRPPATPPAASTACHGADLRLEEGARRCFVGDAELQLTPKEFDLLALLTREEGNVVSRERLMDEVWDINWQASTKTLDVTMARLRQKLIGHGSSSRIVTVRGVGFRFEPATSEAP
jgi:DNA-binding response OmpR family regulator